MALQDFFASSSSLIGILIALVISPVLIPGLLVLAVGVLLWSIIFDRFKVKYTTAVRRDMFSKEPEAKYLTTKDGTRVCYRVGKFNGDGADGDSSPDSHSKIVLFCNPLGMKGFKSWASVAAACGDVWGSDITMICWDYRGYFDSEDPKRIRSVSVRDHALDGAEVLKAVVGDRTADLVVGHSMGVQVALEFALLYPEKVEAMVMLNGTYGHALQTGLQPFFKLPFVGDVICMSIRFLLHNGHEKILEAVRRMAEPFVDTGFRVISRLFGSTEMAKIMGSDDYLLQIWNSYLGGICSNNKTMKAFLRGFQDLDAHTAAHLMHQLGHPTLLIAGVWDNLTPAYNFAVMRRCMPNTRLVIDMFSSHFTCIEHPERVMGEVAHFLKVDTRGLKRADTWTFEKSLTEKLK
eukprot:TRINITY_DN91620_c0_g1_i1.p1 TRINITY_DN91620_c0_g1~~TRINITY_DN91620_c0_g1_i1.p1  ORF type:complete len:427 (+),score=68.91 TRINITY_DN91620_c0_g1_i1:64-1281(+)